MGFMGNKKEFTKSTRKKDFDDLELNTSEFEIQSKKKDLKITDF